MIKKHPFKKNLLPLFFVGIILFSLTLFYGCASIPTRDMTIKDSSMVMLYLGGYGTTGLPVIGDTYINYPTIVELKEVQTLKTYQGIYGYFGCIFYPNIPTGHYIIQKGIMNSFRGSGHFLVDFSHLSLSFDLDIPGTYFLGEYPYKFKQKHILSPIIQAISITTNNRDFIKDSKTLARYINIDNKNKGWQFNPDVSTRLLLNYKPYTTNTTVTNLFQETMSSPQVRYTNTW